MPEDQPSRRSVIDYLRERMAFVQQNGQSNKLYLSVFARPRVVDVHANFLRDRKWDVLGRAVSLAKKYAQCNGPLLWVMVEHEVVFGVAMSEAGMITQSLNGPFPPFWQKLFGELFTESFPACQSGGTRVTGK